MEQIPKVHEGNKANATKNLGHKILDSKLMLKKWQTIL